MLLVIGLPADLPADLPAEVPRSGMQAGATRRATQAGDLRINLYMCDFISKIIHFPNQEKNYFYSVKIMD